MLMLNVNAVDDFLLIFRPPLSLTLAAAAAAGRKWRKRQSETRREKGDSCEYG